MNTLDLRRKDKALQFQYRYSLECWKTVNPKFKMKGHPVDMERIELPLLYDRPRAISPIKSLTP